MHAFAVTQSTQIQNGLRFLNSHDQNGPIAGQYVLMRCVHIYIYMYTVIELLRRSKGELLRQRKETRISYRIVSYRMLVSCTYLEEVSLCLPGEVSDGADNALDPAAGGELESLCS